MLSMNGRSTWQLHAIICNAKTIPTCNLFSCKHDSMFTTYDIRNQNSYPRVFSACASMLLRFDTIICPCVDITVLTLQLFHYVVYKNENEFY